MPNSRASDGTAATGASRGPEGEQARAPARGNAMSATESDGPASEMVGAGEAGEPVDEPVGTSTAELEDELARMEDRYRRSLADLDNYRKRSARDLELRVSDETDALLRDWLEVVDSVDRAAQMAGVGADDGAGLRAVLDQIDAILARQGLERIGAPGERFDPDRHEAIGVRQASELPEHTIAEVARPGFARGERMLRPAQVIVSRAPLGD